MPEAGSMPRSQKIAALCIPRFIFRRAKAPISAIVPQRAGRVKSAGGGVQGLRMNGMDNVSKKSIVVGAAAAFSGEADFRRMIF